MSKDIQDNKVKYLLIGIIIGGVISWMIIFAAANSNNTNVLQSLGIASSNGQEVTVYSSSIDMHFIEQMIPHHQDAITMSRSALTKAKRPEVKLLAQSIINSQTKEIDRMKVWYQEWFRKSLPTGAAVMNTHGMMSNSSQMHMGMMGDQSDLDSLENAADFDRAYIQEMIPHHQMAVMMATMLKSGTNRPEMLQLAQDIITAQTSEIDQMRTWLQEWGN